MARNAGSDLEVEGTLRVVGEGESRAELRDMKPSCDMLNRRRSCCCGRRVARLRTDRRTLRSACVGRARDGERSDEAHGTLPGRRSGEKS